jgi:hypothetical protein
MGLGGPSSWYVIDEIDLVGMIADHAGLARLCDELEALADSLPDPPDREIMRHLQSELENRVPIHDARERALLRSLFGARSATPVAEALLGQIQGRRLACLVQAQDLVAAFKGDGGLPTPDTLGYMLRSFFQTCRQGMAFEELSILHLAGARLTPAARSLLAHSLVQRCGLEASPTARF